MEHCILRLWFLRSAIVLILRLPIFCQIFEKLRLKTILNPEISPNFYGFFLKNTVFGLTYALPPTGLFWLRYDFVLWIGNNKRQKTAKVATQLVWHATKKNYKNKTIRTNYKNRPKKKQISAKLIFNKGRISCNGTSKNLFQKLALTTVY